MSGLSAFFSQNAVKAENIKYVASKRFLDENKEPVEWEIKPITSKEDELLRKSCTSRKPIPGKRNMFQPEADTDKYAGLLGAKCTVFPDLNNKELQDTYGVMSGDELLKAMLLPGEYADYLIKVQEVNGFEVSQEDLVEQAKN